MDHAIDLDEANKMRPQIELMRKVLSGLSEEVEAISEQVKTKGMVPKEICGLCRATDKRAAVEFCPTDRIDRFKEWLREMDVIGIERSLDEYGRDTISFKTSQKLEKIRQEDEDEDGYLYSLLSQGDTRSEKSKYFFRDTEMRRFILKHEMVETCAHAEKHPDNVLSIEFHGSRKKLIKGKAMHKLFLSCNECKERIENTMCDTVHKRGFLFDFDCSLNDIILRRRLSKNGIVYEDLEVDRREDSLQSIGWYAFREPIYYLRQDSIVISQSNTHTREQKQLQDVVKYLKPDLIVTFDDPANLPFYLEFGTNVLFYHNDELSFYDKNRQPEENVGRICEKIVNVLNTYIEERRGKEHDRIVSALYSIAQNLGYIPQLEFGKSGVRIDCVWFDRDGKIQVASEVETSPTWKKDLISTWEVEPKLAVIVGHVKSDKVAENLMKLSLMKSIPHFVLYINKHTEHAFLFDKQELVKFYDLTQNKEETKNSIKVI